MGQGVFLAAGGDLPFRGGVCVHDRLVGLREEAQIKSGREVVVRLPRRLVTFSVTPQVRLRVKPAIGQLLLVRLQRDEFNVVACHAQSIARPG